MDKEFFSAKIKIHLNSLHNTTSLTMTLWLILHHFHTTSNATLNATFLHWHYLIHGIVSTEKLYFLVFNSSINKTKKKKKAGC